MSAHAKLGASSAYRWMNCPGSVALSEGVPKYTSPAAEEGTDAHTLAEMCLTGDSDAADHIGYKLPLGHVVDEEMADAVQVYLAYVRSHMTENSKVYVEKRFDLSKNVHPDMFGTNDACVYREEDETLTVVDYKHGAGKTVEVEDNPQLKYYGLGAALEFNVPVDKVKLVIVQPRKPHPKGFVRDWDIDLIDLLDFSSELVEAAERTKDPDAPLAIGPWCDFCPAAGLPCPKMLEHAKAAAQDIFSPIEDGQPVPEYDREKLAEALELAPILKKWIENVNSFAYNEAIQGRTAPRFKLVNKQASRKWINSVKESKDIKEVFPYLEEKEITKSEILTLPQVEKVIRSKFKGKKFTKEREVELEKLNSLKDEKSTGLTLVPETDKREAVVVGPDSVFDELEED